MRRRTIANTVQSGILQHSQELLQHRGLIALQADPVLDELF